MMGHSVVGAIRQASSQPGGVSAGFGARLLGLPEIFDQHRFVVPDYQRGYAWGERQVQDLLKDIEQQIYLGTHRHYTGTLVLARPAGEAAGVFHVVDGQQRLTTLVLLMAQLAKRLDTPQASLLRERYLVRGSVGVETPVLALNTDAHAFFWERLLGQGSVGTVPVTFATHTRLLNAWKEISDWLDRDDAPGAEAVMKTVERRLGFLVYAPEDDAETGAMFEVINNRGKPLSELEKVKNYLIYSAVRMSAESLRTEIDDAWSIILRNLNDADQTSAAEESAFLRYCLVVYFQMSKRDSQEGYESTKAHLTIPSKGPAAAASYDAARAHAIGEVRGFLSFLKGASTWYARLYGTQQSDAPVEVRSLLTELKAQASLASIMPLFLAVMLRLDKASGAAELLRWLEILNFRVYMARNVTARNDTGQAELYNLAGSYFHGGLENQLTRLDHKIGEGHLNSPEQLLQYRLVKFIFTHSPDDKFAKSFSLEADDVGDFGKWSGLRYFLINLEQSLQPHKTIPIDGILRQRSAGRSLDYFSLEHLWATAYRAGEGENDRPQDIRERRRLGNFVLLEFRLNVQGGNQFIEEKAKRYLGEDGGRGDKQPTKFEHVRKAVYIAREAIAAANKRHRYRSKSYYNDIHKAINDEREDKSKEFALQRWSITAYPLHAALARHLRT